VGILCGVDVFLVAFVVSLVVVGTLLLVATTRKGTVATVAMTKRRMVLHTSVPPNLVFDWLVRQCPPGYKVADADPSRGIVILSSPVSLIEYGFFFPAVVYPEGPGTRVELGIKSKAVQYGPIVTRAHRKLAQALAALTHGSIEGR
jgi:hypothetical protein